MRINLMTRYAIQIIKSISDSDNRRVTSNYIAEDQGISHGVLMKVLRQLRMNDILDSYQGRGEVSGGYSLRKSVYKITLLEILEIMEGPVDLIFMPKQDINRTMELAKGNKSKQYCQAIEEEYQRITAVLKDEMERYTLGELLDLEKVE